MPAPARRSPLARIAAGAALALATTAAANILAARRAERRNPPRGRFISVEGTRLHVIDRGGGRPVVFLHGNGALADEMLISTVPDRLARNHRVLVFDRPGFGHSERPARLLPPADQARLLRRALRQMKIEKPILVGHSWGTLVALEMALQDQDDTAGLVLIGGYYTPTLRLDVPVLSVPAIPVLGDVLSATLWPLVARLAAGTAFRRLFAPAPVTPRFRRGFPTEMAVRPSQLRAGAADAAAMIPAAAAMTRRAQALRMPVVVIAGEGDRIADPRRHSAQLDVHPPGSGVITLPGVGHMLHHTAPDHVVAAVERVAHIAWPAESFPLRQPEPVPPL